MVQVEGVIDRRHIVDRHTVEQEQRVACGSPPKVDVWIGTSVIVRPCDGKSCLAIQQVSQRHAGGPFNDLTGNDGHHLTGGTLFLRKAVGCHYHLVQGSTLGAGVCGWLGS